MQTHQQRIDNARELAELAKKRADEYRAAGAPKMASHHDFKAQEWAATADALEFGGFNDQS